MLTKTAGKVNQEIPEGDSALQPGTWAVARCSARNVEKMQ
jgi:hypothetical protein